MKKFNVSLALGKRSLTKLKRLEMRGIEGRGDTDLVGCPETLANCPAITNLCTRNCTK